MVVRMLERKETAKVPVTFYVKTEVKSYGLEGILKLRQTTLTVMQK